MPKQKRSKKAPSRRRVKPCPECADRRINEAHQRVALAQHRAALAQQQVALSHYHMNLVGLHQALAPAVGLDPRPAVHQCILNAGATEPFSPSASLTSINADPGAVQACVNGVFVINIIVTGGDSENSIVTKVRLA